MPVYRPAATAIGLAGALALAACAPPQAEGALRLFPEGSAEDHAICASVLVITTAIAREESTALFDIPALSNESIARAGVSVLDGSPDFERSILFGDWMLSLPDAQVIPFAIRAQPVCSERYPGFFAELGLV